MFARVSVAAALAAILVALVCGGAFAKAVVLNGTDVITTSGEDRSTATTVWFQGFLADDATGDPINATYNIVARIYSLAAGGALLWGPETHNSVVITEGWFNIELGASSALPSFASPPYYLSLQVNGEYLTPRLKLASVPSAIQSAKSDLLPFNASYGGSDEAFELTDTNALSSDALWVSREGGAASAFAIYARSNSPEATIRSYQYCSAATDVAGAFTAEIGSSNNDSPVIDASTYGAGTAYYGETRGLHGVEIYANASDASADSIVHVVHAVYDGGMRNDTNVAVYGESVGTDIWGVGGQFVGSGIGVYGEARPAPSGSIYYIGVGGYSAHASGGMNIGVYGIANSGATNYAGMFDGNVDVNGTLTKDAGSFKIDHPLDPANKYLSHSFVESPDMKNIYDGVTILDAAGVATVELPDWFEALNQDFRYQLTCIGAFAPVYVANEIAGNRFTIAGGEPGMKVSWQVTGIRHDKYADAHRIPVEETKSPREQGRYRNPELYGAPASAGVHYDARAEHMMSRGNARGQRQERPEAPEGVDPAQQ
jgi:hypothetical protein